MPTDEECLCCMEVEAVVNKCKEADPVPICMTDHPGFEAVWKLQAVYYAYRQYYGHMQHQSLHE